MPRFVVQPGIHTFLRGFATFAIGPFLWMAGNQYNDNNLRLLGAATSIVDGYMFYLSITSYQE